MRLEVFLETVGVSQSTLKGLPPHLGFAVAVTHYWLRHARPRPLTDKYLTLLKALLLGLVYGEFRRRSQGGMAQSMNQNTQTDSHNVEFINIELCEVQPMTPPLLVYQGLQQRDQC